VHAEFQEYQAARKTVEKNRAVRTFFVHLAAYIIGNIFFGIWNVLTYVMKDHELLWFPLPLIFWGVVLLIHYAHSVALFDDWWERDEWKLNLLILVQGPLGDDDYAENVRFTPQEDRHLGV